MHTNDAMLIKQTKEERRGRGRSSAQAASLFPTKLYEMLSDCDHQAEKGRIVSWLPDGKGFKVHIVLGFVNTIMPDYFNQTKYKSFQRQLNLWGFNRVTSNGPEKGSYHHQDFNRDNPAKCLTLNRVRAIKKIPAAERRRLARQSLEQTGKREAPTFPDNTEESECTPKNNDTTFKSGTPRQRSNFQGTRKDNHQLDSNVCDESFQETSSFQGGKDSFFMREAVVRNSISFGSAFDDTPLELDMIDEALGAQELSQLDGDYSFFLTPQAEKEYQIFDLEMNIITNDSGAVGGNNTVWLPLLPLLAPSASYASLCAPQRPDITISV